MSLIPSQELTAAKGRARGLALGWNLRTGIGVAVVACAISAVVATRGQAAFPGENGRLAFTAFSSSSSSQDIFTIAPDGSDLRNHTNHPNTDTGAAFSPDGSQIAFTSFRDGNAEIYKMELNGTGVARLTNVPGGNVEPSFSPDGSRIVFTSFRDGTAENSNAEIYVMNADGSGQTRLTDNPAADSEPVFSPDGSKIAFQSFRNDENRSRPVPEVYIMNANGTDQTRLTTSPTGPEDPTGDAPAGNGDPDFSPDGSKLVFTSQRDANDPEGGDFRTPEIYTMNVDGSEQKRLTDDTSFDVQPVFSPDGSRIAFRRNRQDEIQQIFTMDASDGTDLKQLTSGPSTKVLTDWGVRSSAPLDPPPPEPAAPPAPVAPLPPQLPPPGPPLTEPQRVTEVDRFGGWAAWSAFEEGVGYRLVMRDPQGVTGPAGVAPRAVPFDVDLGPAEDYSVVAVYSRCEQEPDDHGAGGVLLRTTGRGCDLFRLDLSSGRETKLKGASTQQASEYLPSIWRDSIAFARVYEQREGRRGQLPYLYVRPLEGGRSERQPGGSRGDDGLPGPTGLDLYGRRLALAWEWRKGERLRSELRLDTVGGDHQLIKTLGSEKAPANILTPVGDRGRIYAGARRLRESGHESRLLRLHITTGTFDQALLQGPPVVGLGVDEGDFLLATAGDPRQAPQCGPGGCAIRPLEFGSGD